MESVTRGCDWRHAPEASAEDFGRFEKSQLVEIETRARQGETNLCATGAARDEGGADGKVRIERLYLSPYVENPFNSKAIKSFVPELRSRKCFFMFRDSYVIYEYFMNIICTFHIFMYGYATFCRNNKSFLFIKREHPFTFA